MVKEEVLNALSALGFIPKEIEGLGFEVDYEGLNLLYADDDDSNNVNFIVPNSFEVTDENRESVYRAIVELEGRVKYIQTYIMFEKNVWINYIHYLGDNEATPELIEHMINVLAYATSTFHSIINEDDNNG